MSGLAPEFITQPVECRVLILFVYGESCNDWFTSFFNSDLNPVPRFLLFILLVGSRELFFTHARHLFIAFRASSCKLLFEVGTLVVGSLWSHMQGCSSGNISFSINVTTFICLVIGRTNGIRSLAV